jgi:hypothetical protein
LICAIIYFVNKTKLVPTPPNPPPPPFVKGDSPAEVVGGSIFLKWKSGYPASSCGNNICGTSDDTTKLDFDNLDGKTAITATKGWRIHVSDRDPKNGEHNDAVVVCSDSNCSLSPGDGKTYYVQLRTGEVADTASPSNQMHFHDQHYCGGLHEDPRCDKAVHFQFDIGGVPAPDIEACDTSDQSPYCTVFIGTR